MGYCSVRGCTSKSVYKTYNFPKDVDRQQKWLQFSKKPVKFIIKSHHGFCGPHLESERLQTSPAIKNLKPTAVLTIIRPIKFIKQEPAEAEIIIPDLIYENLPKETTDFKEIEELKHFICFFCNKPFNEEIELTKHTLASHKTSKPFKCGCDCRNEFQTMGELLKHRNNCKPALL